MSHTHNVVDTDKHFIIDAATRAITTESNKLSLMQGDHNSEIYTFEMPRRFEGHDMSECNRVEIHYINTSSDKFSGETSKDYYIVSDLRIDEADPEKLLFSWLLSGNTTKYAGSLGFRVSFSCVDDNSTVSYKWSTDIFSGVTVSSGYDNSEHIEKEFSDAFADFETKLEKAKKTETEILTLIDQSGVFDSTDGTTTEKVEKLIDKAEELDIFHCLSNVRFLGDGFPSKAKINLPKINTLNNAFANWNEPNYPIVEELIIAAPLVTDASMMFYLNSVVRRVVLNLSEQCTNMRSTFHASNVEEVVLNFSTENVTNYNNCFVNSFRLKRIVGVFDFTSATNVGDIFHNCSGLTDVEFEPNTLSLSLMMAKCAGLSTDSIQSIIDGLATVETEQSLTLHTTVVGKLTDEQVTQIANKNWVVL